MDLLEEYAGIVTPSRTIEVFHMDISPHTFKVIADYTWFSDMVTDTVPRVRFGSKDPVSHEEYLAEIAKMKEDMQAIASDKVRLEELIRNAPKKKDGTFVNGRIFVRIPYRNTAKRYKSYYDNRASWACFRVKVITGDDTLLWIRIDTDGRG